MRKIAACFLLVFITSSSIAQQTETNPVLTKQDYLQKSKKQKTTAWILLGAGAALVGTGLILGADDAEELSFDDAETYGFITVAGAASILTSIPFFIASERNKKKAATATGFLEFRKEHFYMPAMASHRSFPALAITWKL